MKIAVWNTAFLGDALLTLPLIHTLRQALTDSEIHFFVRKGFEELFSAQPDIEEVHGFDKRLEHKGFLGAIHYARSIKKQHFDVFINAHRSFRSALIALLTGCARRVGYDDSWYNRFCHTHTVARQFETLDEVERLLQLATPFQTDFITWPSLSLPGPCLARAEQFFFKRKGVQARPVIGLHPGSTWATKQWPVEYFSILAKKLRNQGFTVLIFGAKADESIALQVTDSAGREGDDLINMAGKLSLPELGAWIKHLHCFVCNDSGPMHLAWILKTPVVAMFGPTVRELGFFPRGENAFVLERKGLSCRPCSLHGPKVCPLKHHKCMREILPEQAFARILETVKKRNVFPF